MFDELLLNLSDGDKEVQEYIFHYLGYSLLGNPVCRAFLFIWGTAQNGKSTLVRVMRECLGDYCAVIKKDVFLERGKRLHATDLYRIKGVRLAFAVELPKDEKWDEELLKSLTGNDEIQAREIHGKAQSFRAEAVLGFVGNNIPTVDHVDQALADRCRIIGTTFVPDKSDGLWEARLIANECPAIIAKLATYANAVFKNEMRLPQMPEAMMRRTARYLGSQDDFFAWSSDELLTGANHRASEVPLDELKSRFEAWLRRRTETDDDGTQLTGDRVSNKIFQAGLRRLGLTMSDEKGGALMADIGFDGLVRRVKMVRGCAFRVAAVVNS
jgi:putative DNA primase/helicase